MRVFRLSSSVQGRYFPWRFQTAGSTPGFSQLSLMARSPLHYETTCTRRQPSSKSSQAVDFKQSSRSSILSMEVWWRVIAEVHSYDDPIESGELRHWKL